LLRRCSAQQDQKRFVQFLNSFWPLVKMSGLVSAHADKTADFIALSCSTFKQFFGEALDDSSDGAGFALKQDFSLSVCLGPTKRQGVCCLRLRVREWQPKEVL